MPHDTSLYIDFDIAGASPAAAHEVMAAVLQAAPVSSMLIRSGADAALDAGAARALVDLAQKHGVAALLPAAAQIPGNLRPDGVHIAWSPDVVTQYRDIRRSAGPDAIIGADAGRSRHEAMDLGEAGADYVAFGIPPHVEDRTRAAERQLDLVSWWSEVFVIPCVAFDVADVEQARRLAEAGADFIAVTVSAQAPAREAAERVRTFAEALPVHENSE